MAGAAEDVEAMPVIDEDTTFVVSDGDCTSIIEYEVVITILGVGVIVTITVWVSFGVETVLVVWM